jgi:chromosome segregation ATPase
VPSLPDSARTEVQLAERVDAIATWISDLDARLRAAEVATGDEKTAKELRRALEALAKHDPKLEQRLTDRVDVLGDRMATLASTVSTTAAAIAKRDGEIAALRRELDEGSKRIERLVREHAGSIGAEEVEKLRATLRTVAAERPARTSDPRANELTSKVDVLAQRVDTLATTVSTTAAGLAGREGDIAGLRQRLDESSSRIEQTVAELRLQQGDHELANRLESLQSAVAATTKGLAGRGGEIAALRARIDEAYARVGTVVGEIQRSIAALSSQVVALEKLPGASEQALEERAATLGARIDGLAERLDSLSTDVESALGGLADRELEVATLSGSVDEVGTRVDAVVAELRLALSELPAPGAVDPAVDARLEQLSSAVVTVTGQLEELEADSAERARTAVSRAVELEGLLAEVGERLDAVERDRDAAADQLTQAGEVWTRERDWVRAQLETLTAAHEDDSQAHGRLEELATRLDRLDREHVAATQDIALMSKTLDHERASLQGQLDELAAAPRGNDDSERLLAEVGERLDAVERDRDAARGQLARVDEMWTRERDWVRAQLEMLTAAREDEPRTHSLLEEHGVRLDRLDREHEAATAEIALVSQTLDHERTWLQAQLDGLAAALAEASAPHASDDAERMLAELAGRIDNVEHDGAAVASEIARTAAMWASELDSIETRLEQVAAVKTEAAAPARADRETELLLIEVTGRLDAMERDRAVVRAEVARVTNTWVAERSSLEVRLEELATHLAEVESDARRASTDAPSSEDELAPLRVAVDGLRMRLASNEQELATLVSARDVGVRLDEVARRLESLERAPVVIAGSADGGPLPGDGRFRLELRALELRMEHAEAAARENREAVLVQLERLAARIEWRFQRLEAEHDAAYPEAVGGAEVVPIRPEA